MKKKILSIFLTVAMLLSSVALFSVNLVAEVADTPIEIDSAEELAKIGTDANYPLSGNYKLMNDISLEDYTNWTPIGGTYSTPFTGTFDGNNKTISGMTITVENLSSNTTYYGLFVASIGTIENLTVEGTITVKGANAKNYLGIGGIAGRAGNNSGTGTITGCTSKVDITVEGFEKATYIGGIVGQVFGSEGAAISNCNYKGNITVNKDAAPASTAMRIGGIVGSVGATSGNHALSLNRCMNYGKIQVLNETMEPWVAGIVGASYSTSAITIENSINLGALTSNYAASGILGVQLGTGSIAVNNCSNFGVLTTADETYLGGIVSQISGTGAVTLTKCVSSVKLIGSGTGTETNCTTDPTVTLIGYQTRKVGDTLDIRFVSMVSDLTLNAVGYKITVTVNSNDKTAKTEASSVVYSSIKQTVNGVEETLSAPNGCAFYTATVTGISLTDYPELTFKVVPYVMDGEEEVDQNYATVEFTFKNGVLQ